MAAALYYVWDRLNRPLTPAEPIREVVAQLKLTFPANADRFNWFADEAHYTAVPPQDHTPFSVDGWPDPDPQWVVFATDIMVSAVEGTSAAQLIFNHLLASAKDGSAPWIKYLIWKATIYDVRHGWAPQANTGHFDHIHLSTRTDHQFTRLGSWSVVPGGSGMEQKDKLLHPIPQYPSRDVGNVLTDLSDLRDYLITDSNTHTHNEPPATSRIATLLSDVAAIKAGMGTPTVPGLTEDQLRAIIRQELDKSHLTGA